MLPVHTTRIEVMTRAASLAVGPRAAGARGSWSRRCCPPARIRAVPWARSSTVEAPPVSWVGSAQVHVDLVTEGLDQLLAARDRWLSRTVRAGDRHRAGEREHGLRERMGRNTQAHGFAVAAQVPFTGGRILASTSVSPPGQQARTRASARSSKAATRRAWASFAHSTGRARSRGRPFARNTRSVAAGSSGRVPMPYTVSVGRTMSSPRRTASAASRIGSGFTTASSVGSCGRSRRDRARRDPS